MCSSEGDLKPASIHFHFCLFEISMLVRQSVLKRIARNRGHWKLFFSTNSCPSWKPITINFPPDIWWCWIWREWYSRNQTGWSWFLLGNLSPLTCNCFPPIDHRDSQQENGTHCTKFKNCHSQTIGLVSLDYNGFRLSHDSPALFVSIVSCVSSVSHDKQQKYKHMKLKLKNSAVFAIYFDLFAFQVS